MVFVVNKVRFGNNQCHLEAGNKVLCLMKLHEPRFYCNVLKKYKFSLG